MPKKILITGGAGFTGSNAALAFAKKGWGVSILDNLSRPMTDENLLWLNSVCKVNFFDTDIRNQLQVRKIIKTGQFDVILHLAGQAAVTTSIEKPVDDFEINGRGTLNILESARSASPHSFIIFASTNKVYGSMDSVSVTEDKTCYRYSDLPHGVSEEYPLNFHSPYGCSKGTADQYTRDYSRIYGLKTVVFRQSCIYGCRQFGTEDQGWVAWFVIAAVIGRSIRVYGNGKQVRDILFIDDLVDLYIRAFERQKDCNGKIYNVGGGPRNAVSILELLTYLKEEFKFNIQTTFENRRPGDQSIYISDIRKLKNEFSWQPTVSISQGMAKLVSWVKENQSIIRFS